MKKIQAQKAEQSVDELRAVSLNLENWLTRIEPRIDGAVNDQSRLRELRDECTDRLESLQRLLEMSAELQVQHVDHNTARLQELKQRMEAAQKRLWKNSLPRRYKHQYFF